VADRTTNVLFKLRLANVRLEPNIPSATMEQEPLLLCCDCRSNKPRDQFPLRKRNHKNGARGEPSSCCVSCTAKGRDRREKRKRKREEEYPDTTGDPEEADRILSIEQFTALLREKAHTGVISCSTRVSTGGLDDEENKICAGIVGRVWEATGFRFTYDSFHLCSRVNC